MISRNSVIAVCTPLTVVSRSWLMSLIITFMFEPAKLQMNCASASGSDQPPGRPECGRVAAHASRPRAFQRRSARQSCSWPSTLTPAGSSTSMRPSAGGSPAQRAPSTRSR